MSGTDDKTDIHSLIDEVDDGDDDDELVDDIDDAFMEPSENDLFVSVWLFLMAFVFAWYTGFVPLRFRTNVQLVGEIGVNNGIKDTPPLHRCR